MVYSTCGLTNALYRGTKISFAKQLNDLFMKNSTPLALLAVVRTFAEGMKAEFTVDCMFIIKLLSVFPG